MKSRKKKNNSSKIIVIVVIIILVILGIIFFQNKKELTVITVSDEIGEYNYHLNSNSTRIYKKYFNELKEELSDNKIDEEKYVSLISKLFIIDYYTLNNKITNRDIGGVDFIHSSLRDNFVSSSMNSIYKYIKSNLYGKRKQKLPEVNNVEVISIESIKYKNKDLVDDSAYKVICKVGYVKDYDYPKEVTLGIMHEDNKLVIMEIW